MKNEIKGLSSIEAKKLYEEGMNNQPIEAPSKTIKKIIKDNVCTYFNGVFLIISIGSIRNLTFLPIIIANTLIGIVQEIRSKKTIDKLTMLNTPKALVIRDGETFEIPIEELVLNDIVKFKSGNQICADAKIIKGQVCVNESLLTGEEDEIIKEENAFLLSGS